MAANLILPFAGTNTGTNLLTQAEYVGDSQRLVGNQPGVARAKLMNKALRGPSLVAAALAQLVADNQNVDVSDDLTVSALAAMLTQAFTAIAQANQGDSVGMFGFFPYTTAPPGWLKMNGAAVSRATYAKLFAKIGTTQGAGDGSTTFNVPNVRGHFLRALDDGAGIDTGRVLGSFQASQNLYHYHTGLTEPSGTHNHQLRSDDTVGAQGGGDVANYLPTGDAGVLLGTSGTEGNHQHYMSTSADGGTEGRPINSAWLACISYQ